MLAYRIKDIAKPRGPVARATIYKHAAEGRLTLRKVGAPRLFSPTSGSATSKAHRSQAKQPEKKEGPALAGAEAFMMMSCEDREMFPINKAAEQAFFDRLRPHGAGEFFTVWNGRLVLMPGFADRLTDPNWALFLVLLRHAGLARPFIATRLGTVRRDRPVSQLGSLSF